MNYGTILSRLRNEKGYTQHEVAEYISKHANKPYSHKMVSHWENGTSLPPVEQFLLMCEYYGVGDIQSTFRGIDKEYPNLPKLNSLGRNRVNEYISLLMGDPAFVESVGRTVSEPRLKYLKLYDAPAAAGAGAFLDSDAYVDFEVDETVPGEADFAVRVSGDSMEPRFVDGQVIFVKEQQTLEYGEIGIFALNGDSYVKKYERGKLVSLNPCYEPIKFWEFDSIHIFGKVVGG